MSRDDQEGDDDGLEMPPVGWLPEGHNGFPTMCSTGRRDRLCVLVYNPDERAHMPPWKCVLPLNFLHLGMMPDGGRGRARGGFSCFYLSVGAPRLGRD